MSTFPKYATTATPFPKYSVSAATFPSYGKALTLSEEEEKLIPRGDVFPPDIITEERKTKSASDFEYEEPLTVLENMRDHLEELKLGWPLSDEQEDEIEAANKESKYPQGIDNLLIREAFVKASSGQKKAMIDLADKIHYSL